MSDEVKSAESSMERILDATLFDLVSKAVEGSMKKSHWLRLMGTVFDGAKADYQRAIDEHAALNAEAE